MKRLHIICEGLTEETFVREMMAPYLRGFGVEPIPSQVGKPGHKGGNVTTARMVLDIRNRLLGDPEAWCSTFFDFYGLDSRFAGKLEADRQHSGKRKAEEIERALTETVLAKVGSKAIRRFVPYIQMYEFEGLLFSDPAKLAKGLFEDDLERELAEIRSGFGTPEDINDSLRTAPSKRILALVPGYEKPLYGSLAALEIGLETIRGACPRFAQWMGTLEKLA